MRVVAVSDTHNHEVELPEGDLLIIAGDVTMTGTEKQVARFGQYVERESRKFTHKPILVAGNHDFLFQTDRQLALSSVAAATYLEDELVEIAGKRIYGSPWTPTFFEWAFMKDRGDDIRRQWDLIPEGLDILITHGPPHGILDDLGKHVGCEELRDTVAVRLNSPPRFHVFGHIHEGHGSHDGEHTRYLNVAVCNEHYMPVHPPTVFDV
jgi:Icc-related predicted phosphoesterase